MSAQLACELQPVEFARPFCSAGARKDIFMNFSFWWRAFVSPVGLCACLSLGWASSSLAQEEEHNWTINVGSGTTITGSDAGKLDHGGNVQGGAGYFLNRYLGITENFMFNHLGITGNELALLNEQDGNARVYTFTADLTLRLRLGSRANIYMRADGGHLRRTIQFTQPTVAQTVVFDPWWGHFGPAVIPANQVLGTFTSNLGAFDAVSGHQCSSGRNRTVLVSGGALYAWFHQLQRYGHSSPCVRCSMVGEG
jgi:hypothetical protein